MVLNYGYCIIVKIAACYVFLFLIDFNSVFSVALGEENRPNIPRLFSDCNYNENHMGPLL